MGIMEWILINVIAPIVIGALIGVVVAILIILYRERRKLRDVWRRNI